MIVKRIGFAAAALIGLVFAASGIARGDLIITATNDNGSTNGTAGSGIDSTHAITHRSAFINMGWGDMLLNIQSSDGGDNATNDSITTTSIDISNNSAGPETLHIVVADSFFTGPLANGTLDQTLSSTYLGNQSSSSSVSTSDLVKFTSSLTPSGLGVPGMTLPSTIAPNLGPGMSPALSPIVSPPPNGEQFTGAWPLSPFEMAQDITITLGTGEKVVLTASTSFVAGGPGAFTPEPSTVTGLAGLGAMMGLGLVWKRRRRFSV
jgi:hypothetical protein